MIRVMFLGDGERDAATVPRLVEGILGMSVKEETVNWKDLHLSAGRGYRRKLLYAVRRAKAHGLAAVVATVDTDKDRDGIRLRELRVTRDYERSRLPQFPMVLGQADPHGEAWLLDDPVAVRGAFNLAGDIQIVTVRRTESPKDQLETIKKASGRADDRTVAVLADIARNVKPSRCIHAKETGFHTFQEEVRQELGPVASGCGDVCRCGDACGHEARKR